MHKKGGGLERHSEYTQNSALNVDLNISSVTLMLTPVSSLICLILAPPLPIMAPAVDW